MPHVIAHFGKLVEDDAVGFLLQFVGFIEDFLHVGFRAGGRDDLAGHRFQPFKTFPAHALGKDGHGAASQQF